MIKILIIEDNDIVRQNLMNLLEEAADMEVTGAVAGGTEALALIDAGLIPDIIVTDLNMPGIDGLELTRLLLIRNPAARVIIMTMHPNTTYPIKAAAIGAKGYLIKGEDFDDLFNGIRAVYSGETYISPGLWH